MACQKSQNILYYLSIYIKICTDVVHRMVSFHRDLLNVK